MLRIFQNRFSWLPDVGSVFLLLFLFLLMLFSLTFIPFLSLFLLQSLFVIAVFFVWGLDGFVLSAFSIFLEFA